MLQAGLDVRVVLAAITWNVKKIWTVYIIIDYNNIHIRDLVAYLWNDVRLHIYIYRHFARGTDYVGLAQASPNN